MISIIDLAREYQEISGEADIAVRRVLTSGTYILGPESSAFEKEIATYCSVKEAIGLNSGTDAVLLALRALDIQAGDEVICPAMTFFASAEPIAQLNAKTVFVDIDPQTFTIDPVLVERAITPKTKAIMVVHLYGQAADMAPLLAVAQKHRIPIIEDAAQAIGAEYQGKKVGSFGSMACLSFFPTKNLGACGDGGAVLTSSPELADRVRRLRNHGSKIKYHHEEIGYNSRLDEIQAAILRIKLRYLDRWNEHRRTLADVYRDALRASSIQCPVEAPGRRHVYHLFSIRSKKRDALMKYLSDHEIASAKHYPAPLHLQPAMAELGYKAGDFPASEQLSQETLSLPLHAHLTIAQVRQVCAAVTDFERLTA